MYSKNDTLYPASFDSNVCPPTTLNDLKQSRRTHHVHAHSGNRCVKKSPHIIPTAAINAYINTPPLFHLSQWWVFWKAKTRYPDRIFRARIQTRTSMSESSSESSCGDYLNGSPSPATRGNLLFLDMELPLSEDTSLRNSLLLESPSRSTQSAKSSDLGDPFGISSFLNM